MATTAEATYYDNAYFIAHPLRRSAKLEVIGRIGQTTIIPWMRLIGLTKLSAKVSNVGTVSYPMYAYTAIPDDSRVPPELVELRPFITRAIGDLLRVCGVETLTLKVTPDELVKDMEATWAAFGELPEQAVRITGGKDE